MLSSFHLTTPSVCSKNDFSLSSFSSSLNWFILTKIKTLGTGDVVRKPNQKVSEMSFGELMTSGTIAGLLQIILTYPLELVKTRLTISREMLNSRGQKSYSGIFDCFRETITKEGYKGLFKGIGPTLVTGGPYIGLQMAFYDVYKKFLGVDENQGTNFQVVLLKLVAGAMSGVTAQSLTYPGDTVRRRMQTNGIGGEQRKYKNSFDAVKKMFVQEGGKSFFRGMLTDAIRCIPGAAIQFVAYDLLKSSFGL